MDLDKVIFGLAEAEYCGQCKIDPRVMLLAALVLLIVIASTTNIAVYALLSLVLLLGIMLVRIHPKVLWTNFRPFILIALLTFFLHLIFSSRGGGVILNLAGIKISDRGLISGALFAWRILLFFCVTILVNVSSDPLDISEAFTRLLAPLKKLKLPVAQWGLLVFMALRFVPLIFEEARMIYATQVSRGYNPRGGPIKKLRNAGPFLSALLACSVRRAANMATALEARGFIPDRERSSFRIFRIGAADYIIGVVILIILAGSLLLGSYA